MNGKEGFLLRILVIDGQGGGIGSRLIAALLPVLLDGCELIAVGTNALATNAMRKAGAKKCATGENPVLYNAPRAGCILGPIGIVLANGMLGEITPAMAAAVSGAEGVKVLIPSTKCSVYVAGTQEAPLEVYLQQAIARVRALLGGA